MRPNRARVGRDLVAVRKIKYRWGPLSRTRITVRVEQHLAVLRNRPKLLCDTASLFVRVEYVSGAPRESVSELGEIGHLGPGRRDIWNHMCPVPIRSRIRLVLVIISCQRERNGYLLR
jgi:hypothetical protein